MPSRHGKHASPRLTITLSADLLARLIARAQDEGRKLSDVARDALERHVKEEG